MKRIILPLFVSLLLVFAMFGSAFTAVAEGEFATTSDEDYYLIPVDKYETIYDDIRQQVLEEFSQQLEDALNTGYKDVTAECGQVILIPNGSEIIYRGGGAVAITASNGGEDGLTDISVSKEVYSGQKLEYGHIYTSKAGSPKAVLVVGKTASFTIRGNYEID